jgi:hypothetical protein
MELEIGSCYEVELTDNSIVRFRFFGDDDEGEGLSKIEVPPGSNNFTTYEELIGDRRSSIRQINCL